MGSDLQCDLIAFLAVFNVFALLILSGALFHIFIFPLSILSLLVNIGHAPGTTFQPYISKFRNY